MCNQVHCLCQLYDFRRCLASQYVKLEVLAGNDAVIAQLHLDGLPCQFRVIVLFREMSEPDMLQLRGRALSKSHAALDVGEMSVVACDTVLEILRIRSVLQHLRVMVCFQHEIVCLRDMLFHVVRDHSCVSDEAEYYIAVTDKVSVIVGTVMWDIETCDGEIAYFECLAMLYVSFKSRFYLLPYTVVLLNAVMYSGSGVYRQEEFA